VANVDVMIRGQHTRRYIKRFDVIGIVR